jgi:thiaminase
MATTLYITEGVYADWARRLVDEGRVPDDPLYKGWIDIHADQALADFVAYLDGCIERSEDTTGLDRTFARTLRLEKAFWDALYPDT